jgi:hypothetical protein
MEVSVETSSIRARLPQTVSNGNGNGKADGMLANAKQKVSSVAQNPDSLAKGLGWFSVGLGLAQLAMPDRVARLCGIEADGETITLMRSLGLRELTSGVGILTQPKPDKWLWSRVLGDVMDLALLGAAMSRDDAERGKTIGATLAVLGVTGLDILAAKEMAKERADMEQDDEPIGEQTEVRSITIKAHPSNVEKEWNDWVWAEGGDESREAAVTFAPAPGARGTEIRAELTYTPKAGKLGTAVAKLAHKSPGQMLGQDLKHFKQMMELGEVVHSDASIHSHMHPAQPDDSVEVSQ